MSHLSNGFQQLGRYDVRNRLEEASSRSQRHQCRHKQNNLCFGVSHIQFVWRDIDNSRGPSHGGGQIIGRKKPFLTLVGDSYFGMSWFGTMISYRYINPFG